MIKRVLSLKVLIFLAVLAFTFILRAHNYDRTPTSWHLDEMLYAWSGIYTVETGIPVSWSTLDYPERAKVFVGKVDYQGGIPESSVTLYKPWLDQPPLFSILVGYYAHIFGADREDFIPAAFIRFPMIFVSTLTSILVFLIARKLVGYWSGILSMLFYGTVPILVFASRTALPETVIAMAFTLTVYLLLKFRDKFNYWFLVPIPLLAGFTGLMKPTGYFILPFAIFFVFKWLHKSKKTKQAIRAILLMIVATIPFVVAFYIYGLGWDAEIFWRISAIQATRPAGFGSLAWYFTTPSYDTAVSRDAWFVFCLLSSAFYLFRRPKGIKSIVPWAFAYWVAVVMISGGEWDLLAWYRFPSYPFLAIMGAWGIRYLVSRADFFASFIAVGLLLGNRPLLVNAFRPNVSASFYRISFSFLMMPSILRSLFTTSNFKFVSQAVIVFAVVLGIYMNSIYVYQAYDIACENKVCPITEGTYLSGLYFPMPIRWFIINLPARIF